MADREIIMTLKVGDCRFSTLGHDFNYKGEIYKPGILLSSNLSATSPAQISLTPEACAEITDEKIGSFAYIDLIEKVTTPNLEINLASAGNILPRSTWTNGIKIYVTDAISHRILVYDFNTHEYLEAENIPLAANNPRGIWSDGTTIWVADSGAHKLHAYAFEQYQPPAPPPIPPEYVTPVEIDFATGHDNCEGIWSDGTTMYVADRADRKIYAYTLATGERDTSKEFNLYAGNSNCRGITSDGITMYTVDKTDDHIYAYTLATGARDISKEFDLFNDNSAPEGIFTDGTILYVVDRDDHVYAYTLATGVHLPDRRFSLNSDNASCGGIWSDGVTLWISDEADARAYAYTLADGSYDSSKDFSYAIANSSPRGIWSDQNTMWVADLNDDKIYIYGAADGFNPVGLPSLEQPAPPPTFRKPDEDFEGLQAAGNTNPYGIYGFDNHMYVVDATARRVYVYDRTTKGVLLSEGIGPGETGSEPVGVCILNDTIYVSDINENNIKAWDLHPTFRERNTSKDIQLPAANSNVQDITPWNENLYATDWNDRRVYVYDPITKNRRDGSSNYEAYASHLRVFSSVTNLGRQLLQLEFQTPEATLNKSEREYWNYEFTKRKYGVDWFKNLNDVENNILTIEMEN